MSCIYSTDNALFTVRGIHFTYAHVCVCATDLSVRFYKMIASQQQYQNTDHLIPYRENKTLNLIFILKKFSWKSPSIIFVFRFDRYLSVMYKKTNERHSQIKHLKWWWRRKPYLKLRRWIKHFWVFLLSLSLSLYIWYMFQMKLLIMEVEWKASRNRNIEKNNM